MLLQAIEDKAQEIDKAFQAEAEAVRAERDPDAVERLRVKYLGRKSATVELMSELGKLEKQDKPKGGQAINRLKTGIEREIEALAKLGIEWALAQKLARPPLDFSLPSEAQRMNGADRTGSLHPVTLMQNLLVQAFRRMGFSVYDGPEVELDYYNFSALNFQDHHPARDMQDTFHVAGPGKMVLRTHTSPVQIHAMLAEKPPIKIIVPGRVFRCDSDLTHTPMFHQLEAVVVDRRISFAHLKGSIDVLLKSIFGENLSTRLRPSYFPFVEPGAEIDMQCHECQGKGCRLCKQSGWLEVGGCGMIHPNVFESVGLDSETYTGYAFGFGLDRLAMLKFGVQDLRLLFASDYQFLSQFPIHMS